MTTPRRYGLFINGEFCDAASGKTFESINPATGAVESVPRHTEIPNGLVLKICRGLGIPEVGKG